MCLTFSTGGWSPKAPPWIHHWHDNHLCSLQPLTGVGFFFTIMPLLVYTKLVFTKYRWPIQFFFWQNRFDAWRYQLGFIQIFQIPESKHQYVDGLPSPKKKNSKFPFLMFSLGITFATLPLCCSVLFTNLVRTSVFF